MELKQLISEKSICKLTCNNFKILYLRTRGLFLWSFSYGYSFQKCNFKCKQTVHKWFFVLIFIEYKIFR